MYNVYNDIYKFSLFMENKRKTILTITNNDDGVEYPTNDALSI